HTNANRLRDGAGVGAGSGSRTRTYDPRINSPLLYQLSYAGTRARKATQNSIAFEYPSRNRHCRKFIHERFEHLLDGRIAVFDELDALVPGHHRLAARD